MDFSQSLLIAQNGHGTTAKPLFSSSNLDGTSQKGLQKHCGPLFVFVPRCLFAFQCGNGYDKMDPEKLRCGDII